MNCVLYGWWGVVELMLCDDGEFVEVVVIVYDGCKCDEMCKFGDVVCGEKCYGCVGMYFDEC